MALAVPGRYGELSPCTPVRVEIRPCAQAAICRFSTSEVPGVPADLPVDGLTALVELPRERCGIGERRLQDAECVQRKTGHASLPGWGCLVWTRFGGLRMGARIRGE